MTGAAMQSSTENNLMMMMNESHLISGFIFFHSDNLTPSMATVLFPGQTI